MAATTSTIISLPTLLGLSIRIFMPVFIPEPTNRGRMPMAFSTALKIVVFKGGTTEERIEPSISDNWMWCISRMFLKWMAYSVSVRPWSVVTRSMK